MINIVKYPHYWKDLAGNGWRIESPVSLGGAYTLHVQVIGNEDWSQVSCPSEVLGHVLCLPNAVTTSTTMPPTSYVNFPKAGS